MSNIEKNNPWVPNDKKAEQLNKKNENKFKIKDIESELQPEKEIIPDPIKDKEENEPKNRITEHEARGLGRELIKLGSAIRSAEHFLETVKLNLKSGIINEKNDEEINEKIELLIGLRKKKQTIERLIKGI